MGMGVQPDPEKVAGIENFPKPNNITELKRFLGMVNYLTRCAPELSTVTGHSMHCLKETRCGCGSTHNKRLFKSLKPCWRQPQF